MASKKDLEAIALSNLEMMKTLAKGNPEALKLVEANEKKLKEALGSRETIGPCALCKSTKTVSQKEASFERSKWFKCGHEDHIFCPDCLRKPYKEAKEKREKEKEQKKKEKKGKK